VNIGIITAVDHQKEVEMDYSTHMIARAEYDRMVHSVPSVPEYSNGNEAQRRPMNWLRAIFLSILNLVA